MKCRDECITSQQLHNFSNLLFSSKVNKIHQTMVQSQWLTFCKAYAYTNIPRYTYTKLFYFLIRIFNTNFLYHKFFLVSFASFHLLYRYFPRPFRCFLPCNVFLLQLSTFFLFQFGAKTYMCTLRNTVFVACSIHILAMVVSLSSLLSFSFSID